MQKRKFKCLSLMTKIIDMGKPDNKWRERFCHSQPHNILRGAIQASQGSYRRLVIGSDLVKKRLNATVFPEGRSERSEQFLFFPPNCPTTAWLFLAGRRVSGGGRRLSVVLIGKIPSTVDPYWERAVRRRRSLRVIVVLLDSPYQRVFNIQGQRNSSGWSRSCSRR